MRSPPPTSIAAFSKSCGGDRRRERSPHRRNSARAHGFWLNLQGRMRMPELPAAFDRALGPPRAVGELVRDRSSVLGGSALRASGRLRLPGTPRSLQLLAQRDIQVDHRIMGKSDLDAVLARRSEIAREVAALEAMRAEMEAEDQELLVAERVLRRLSDAPA